MLKKIITVTIVSLLLVAAANAQRGYPERENVKQLFEKFQTPRRVMAKYPSIGGWETH